MSDDYSYPMIYADVRFRSRLEARWTTFFDLLRIPWNYEVEERRRWHPDFRLRFLNPLAVEVKPRYTDEDLLEERDRTAASGRPGGIVLLGENPNLGKGDTNKVGLIFEVTQTHKVTLHQDAKVIRCEACDRYGINQEGDHCQYADCTGPTEIVDSGFLKHHWDLAGNHTQWEKEQADVDKKKNEDLIQIPKIESAPSVANTPKRRASERIFEIVDNQVKALIDIVPLGVTQESRELCAIKAVLLMVYYRERGGFTSKDFLRRVMAAPTRQVLLPFFSELDFSVRTVIGIEPVADATTADAETAVVVETAAGATAAAETTVKTAAVSPVTEQDPSKGKWPHLKDKLGNPMPPAHPQDHPWILPGGGQKPCEYCYDLIKSGKRASYRGPSGERYDIHHPDPDNPDPDNPNCFFKAGGTQADFGPKGVQCPPSLTASGS